LSSAFVDPNSLRSFFHLPGQRYPPRMGSHGRRQPETRMVPVLNCQACGGLTSGAALSLRLRAPYLRPLRCGESGHTCVRRADPRHLRPLHHNRRVLRAGNGSQSRSHPWPTRARHQPEGPARRLLAYLGATHGAYANTIAPTRATAKATCASLSSPSARTCSASTNDSGMSQARTYTRTAL
jgi:hypothetical protein